MNHLITALHAVYHEMTAADGNTKFYLLDAPGLKSAKPSALFSFEGPQWTRLYLIFSIPGTLGPQVALLN